jgi:arabinose-5-phosphate isomerase
MDKARSDTVTAATGNASESAAGDGAHPLAEQAAFAREVLRAEAQAINAITIDQAFHDAVEMILACTGTLVVSGMGKNGPIAQKLSATFASTGAPSHFLHPTEAVHGDLGRIRANDLVLLLSRSGNTDEIVTLAALLKQDHVRVIGVAAKRQSDLGRLATLTLCIGETPEACPLQLAPTASTTAILALGDALALSVSRRRNFGIADFRKFHPGGALGRELMPVAQVLRLKAGENLPLFTPAMSVEEAFAAAETQAPGGRRPGALVIADDAGKLLGVFTDGDLRRLLIKHGPAALPMKLADVMTANPRHLTAESLVRDAVQMAREYRIDEMPVVDQTQTVIGLLDVQDLMALKVIE